MFVRNLIIVLVIALSLNLSAQHKPFQFGFKVGSNIGWYSTSEEMYENKGVDIGGSWGFIADFFIMENYSFTTGFDVLYLNGTMSYPSLYEYVGYQNKGTLVRSYHTKYIKLPLVFTMKTNQINKLRYYGQIGLGFNVLLTAKADDEFTPDGNGNVISESHNIYNELRFSRESFILGAGIEVPLQGSTYLRIGLVFDNSFINILKGDNSFDSSVKNNGRNSFFGLEVSILF